jgi:hypothetical protein
LTAVKDAPLGQRNNRTMEACVTLDRDRLRVRIAWLCLGVLSALAAVVAALLVAQARPPGQAANLLLIYVGAEDCAPCRAWQRGDGATFRSSAAFNRLTYREVKPPHLRDVLKDESWPEDIRYYRDRLKRSDGVPLWLVVSNDDIVVQRFGAASWRSKILPRIRSYLR